jgi:hypothetical protein
MIYKLSKSTDGQFRSAYIETLDAIVVGATPALRFMMGWPYQKVQVKATEHGYRIALQVNMSRPKSMELADGETAKKPTTNELAKRTSSEPHGPVCRLLYPESAWP